MVFVFRFVWLFSDRRLAIHLALARALAASPFGLFAYAAGSRLGMVRKDYGLQHHHVAHNQCLAKLIGEGLSLALAVLLLLARLVRCIF